MNEEPLWKGSPSQWLNLWPFTFALLVTAGICVGGVFFFPVFIALVLPLGYMIWSYLLVRSSVFELTSQRLRITSGVFNQKIDEVELYRVKDTQMLRPWWMRLTNLASLRLDTSDRSSPMVLIPAVHRGVELREQLRKQVEIIRDSKRVREMDFDDAGGDDFDRA